MALYIPHSIFHVARLLYVRPETFGPYYKSSKLPEAVLKEINQTTERLLTHIFVSLNLGIKVTH